MLESFIPDLTPEDAKVLEKHLIPKKALRGNVILEEASNTRDLYFVISGKVDVYQRMEHSGQVMALRVARLEGPVLIGESNMFLGRQRNASVVTSEDTFYGIMPYGNLLRLKKENTDLYIRLIEYASQVMATRILDTQEHVQKQVLKRTDTPGRALAFFKMLNDSVTICRPALAKKLFGGAKFFSE